ncbi:hypothetical protein [Methylobacterium sp. 77]|uniref:hypothetical protein n=1 Tax=Methylobacterium sp. 77 TaxID=1101192 RepID=UPI001FD9C088|nr:hypothetical protein [Methylobacterium sp. 77]
MVLLSLLALVLPSIPQGHWAGGVSVPVASQWPDGMSGQAEVPSANAVSRLEADDAVMLRLFPEPRMLGLSSAPSLRGRSALSLGINAKAPLHRPPRVAA